MSDEKKSIWPMTDVQIAAIRERSDKATDGPWGVFRECGGRKRFGIATQKSLDDNDTGELDAIVDYEGRDSGILKEADAAFIAHAREDVPALLAEVARLQKVARLIGLHREAENQELLAEVERLKDEVASLEQELKFSDETEYELIKKLFDLKICHKETICEQADAQELNFEGESGCLFCWRQWAIRKARKAASEEG